MDDREIVRLFYRRSERAIALFTRLCYNKATLREKCKGFCDEPVNYKAERCYK